jgi:hypothetical protein
MRLAPKVKDGLYTSQPNGKKLYGLRFCPSHNFIFDFTLKINERNLSHI